MNTSFIIVSFLILGVFSAIIPASHSPISTQLYGYDAKGKTTSMANDNHNQLGTNYDISNQVNTDRCISYDKSERSILISCGLVHLTDIANQINEQNVIKKESDGNWLLDAGIIIEKGATLILDPRDTKWLKILADGNVAHGIHVGNTQTFGTRNKE